MLKTLAEYERERTAPQEKDTQNSPLMELSAPGSLTRKGGGIVNTKEFVLMHPERPRNGTVVWEKAIIVNGQSYPVICDNGLIRTREETLKDFFIGQGWILERTMEDTDGKF